MFFLCMIAENQVQRTDDKTDLGMMSKVAGTMWKRCSPEVRQVGMQSTHSTYKNNRGGYYFVQDGYFPVAPQVHMSMIWSEC